MKRSSLFFCFPRAGRSPPPAFIRLSSRFPRAPARTNRVVIRQVDAVAAVLPLAHRRARPFPAHADVIELFCRIAVIVEGRSDMGGDVRQVQTAARDQLCHSAAGECVQVAGQDRREGAFLDGVKNFSDALPPRTFRHVIQMVLNSAMHFPVSRDCSVTTLHTPARTRSAPHSGCPGISSVGDSQTGAVNPADESDPCGTRSSRPHRRIRPRASAHGLSSAHSSRSMPPPATAPYAAAPPESRSDRLLRQDLFPDQRLAVFKMPEWSRRHNPGGY